MRLINERGRIVEVKEGDVKKLMATGKWLNAPEGQGGDYSPVFDRTRNSQVNETVNLEEHNRVERQYLEVVRI